MDWVVALGLVLACVATAYSALAVRHSAAASLLFILAAAILGYKVVEWGTTVQIAIIPRIVFAGFLGAVIAVGIVEGLRFANLGGQTERQDASAPQLSTLAETHTPSPAPSAAPVKGQQWSKPTLPLSPHNAEQKPLGASPLPAAPVTGTAKPTPPQAISDQRAATLRQLTQLYILSHDGITPRMMAGLELPPASFLNEELERQGAKWRVRDVNGGNADTYAVP